MKAAIQLGAIKVQIFEIILISEMIAETSTLALGLSTLEK